MTTDFPANVFPANDFKKTPFFIFLSLFFHLKPSTSQFPEHLSWQWIAVLATMFYLVLLGLNTSIDLFNRSV